MINNLPGIRYCTDFISPKEEQQLIKKFQTLAWQEVALFGQIAKRRVVHYGMDYNYERRTAQSIGGSAEKAPKTGISVFTM